MNSIGTAHVVTCYDSLGRNLEFQFDDYFINTLAQTEGMESLQSKVNLMSVYSLYPKSDHTSGFLIEDEACIATKA